MKDVNTLLARILISLVFIFSGIRHILFFDNSIEYMKSFHVPATSFFLIAAIICLVLGSLSILLGYKIKRGSFLLMIFLIPVSCIFHWNFSDPMELIQLMKNLGLIAALLLLVSHGAGKYSISGR